MRTNLVLLSAIAALLSLPVLAAPPTDAGALGYFDAGHSHTDGQGVGQEQIIESVQRRYNAKVIRVTETSVEGRRALKLRLMSAQRVWSVVVDANSGRVLSGG